MIQSGLCVNSWQQKLEIRFIIPAAQPERPLASLSKVLDAVRINNISIPNMARTASTLALYDSSHLIGAGDSSSNYKPKAANHCQ
jgi:hypothetical protein